MSEVIDPALVREVAERVERVQARIRAACERAERDPAELTLVGACKRQPLERIAAAVCAGVTSLGENYVQEARAKQNALTDLLARHCAPDTAPNPEWRLIGHLQRNKARHAVTLFCAVDSVDRPELARELDKRAGAAGTRIDLCLQVNLSGEASKSGTREADLPELLAACEGLEHVRVIGLMTMPAPSADPEVGRGTFARLRALRDTLSREPGGAGLTALNMGMSGDFEVAIEEGATLVRIGSALFGERPARETE
ncbi:MAG: YggS family pyridoxal phosphate-dependent enzyme [Deltaproteobacteria bacterium]|nr:YggS family pyridoxal phosphate-dependent enzyme [Deltaproteobacteria bacterium]